MTLHGHFQMKKEMATLKAQAKFWFRKVLSIVHAILNAKTEYVIWCDGDAHFVNNLDDLFADGVKFIFHTRRIDHSRPIFVMIVGYLGMLSTRSKF